MSSALFKVTDPRGFTRRLTFPDMPNWPTLGARISSLWAIPLDKVAVTYIDSDGDEVTLSSNEELQEYYQTSFTPGQAIKFNVKDLRNVHKSSVGSTSPSSVPNRKMFEPVESLPVMFDVDDDWQRLPSLGGMYMQHPDSIPHAYVETIDSESQVGSKDNATVRDDMSVSDLLAKNTMPIDKGKEKESEDLQSNPKDVFSSTASIIADSPPDKLPVHVYDIGENASLKTPKSAVPPVLAPEILEALVSVAQDVNNASANNADSMDTDEAVGPPPPSPPNASVTQDVASLLNDLMGVFSSHPEISEGIRNIVRNATNGTYWSTHRDAVSRAADQIRRVAEGDGSRAAEDLRRAEEEAGRRVSEALGRFFGSLGNLGARPNTSAPVNAPPASASPTNAPRVEQPQQDPLNPLRPSWAHLRHGGSFGRPPPGLFYPFAPERRGSWGPWYHHPPPVPPPPPNGSHVSSTAPPPPPPPPHLHHMAPGMPPPFVPSVVPPVDVPRVPMHPQPPPPANMGYGSPWAFGHLGNQFEEHPTSSGDDNLHSTSQGLREAVERAKARYKTEKERYRRDREERQKARERRTTGLGFGRTMPGDIMQPERPATPEPMEEPTVHLVSNARGSFPQVEMFSVPRRYNTVSGYPHHSRVVNPHSRAVHNITKRLSDMGFTESAYPELPDSIKAKIPEGGEIVEDDIVTTLIEDLLSRSPKPIASGSGLKHETIPGAWS